MLGEEIIADKRVNHEGFKNSMLKVRKFTVGIKIFEVGLPALYV